MMIIFGKKLFGIKLRGIGHDHHKTSKSALINQLVKLLNTQGFWLEASGHLRDVLIGKKASFINDPEMLQKLYDQKIAAKEDGSYVRFGETQTTFGKPKI